MEYLYDMIQYGTEANKRELFEVNRKEIDNIAERMKQYDLASPAEKRKAIRMEVRDSLNKSPI